jgi:hypothetical protein
MTNGNIKVLGFDGVYFCVSLFWLFEILYHLTRYRRYPIEVFGK